MQKTKIRTKIIAAFPGCGKTMSHNKRKQTSLDSDSSNFSWDVVNEDGTRKRNPNFPKNYIQHIKNNIGKYEYIFVSTHKEVREALKDECIFFYLVFPGFGAKDDYVKRYQQRGSSEEFILLLDKNWIEWNQELYLEKEGCAKYIIGNRTLEDLLNEFEQK